MIAASRLRKIVANYVQVFWYIACPRPTYVLGLVPKFIMPFAVKLHSCVTRSPVRTGQASVR
jgi:ABC-type dipeptide/oligopeptide/nickel transport system permease component